MFRANDRTSVTKCANTETRWRHKSDVLTLERHHEDLAIARHPFLILLLGYTIVFVLCDVIITCFQEFGRGMT
jgi:hypothetical protein